MRRLIPALVLGSCALALPEAAQAKRARLPYKPDDVEEMFNDYKPVSHLKELIEKRKVPIDVRRPKDGYTPLLYYLSKYPYKFTADLTADGTRQKAQFLLEAGASLSEKTPPLQYGRWKGKNGEINYRFTDGLNPLQLVVWLGKAEAIDVVLRYDRNTRVRDRYGNTLLHLAVASSPTNVQLRPRELLAKVAALDGQDIDAVNDQGQTPLTMLLALPSFHGEHEQLEFFYDRQAKRTIKDRDGHDADYYAATVNPWAKAYLDKLEADHRMAQRLREVARNNEASAQAMTASGPGGGCGQYGLNDSFSLSYHHYLQDMYGPPRQGQRSSSSSEPIVIQVTRTHVAVSSLEPHYGRFEVCRSGQIGDKKVYEFKQTATNRTYTLLAVGADGNAMIRTSSGGQILLSKGPFEFRM